MARIKLGVLVSGGGSNLQAIMDACDSKQLDAEVVFVGSDNPDAKGLDRAAQASIPSFVTDYDRIRRNYLENQGSVMLPGDFDIEDILEKQRLFPEQETGQRVQSFFRIKALAERDLLENMKPFSFDLLVLAGFMRILSPYFIDHINKDPEKPRIMNIHPALLPSFPGLDGYADTFDYGCKVGGCTVHFVDYGEDSGPIIGQKSFDIAPEDTLETVRSKGLELEWVLFPECIRLFSENRLILEQRGEKRVVRVIPSA